MTCDPIETRGAGKPQVFDVSPESPSEQDRLNGTLRRKALLPPTSRWAIIAGIALSALVLGALLGFLGRSLLSTP